MASKALIPYPLPDPDDQVWLSISSRDCINYRVLFSGCYIPELWDDDCNDDRQRYLRCVYIETLLDKHTSQIDTFFGEERTVATYLHVYTLFHCVVDGQETLRGPWTSDDERFNGALYSGPTLPVYDPREIKVGGSFRKESNILLRAELNGEPVLCVVPDLLGTKDELMHELKVVHLVDELVPKFPALSIARLKGVLGFSSGEAQYPYVVGYILQDGICSLSEASIWGPSQDHFCAKLERCYKQLHDWKLTWGGKGPENITLDQDMEPFFDSLSFRWHWGHLEDGDDSQAMEKVMSFLKKRPGSKPRRSLRILKQGKSKQDENEAVDADGARPWKGGIRFQDLPADVIEMIFELVLLAPERKFNWVYNHFAIEKKSWTLERWQNWGLTEILPRARSIFYTWNDFVVDVNRLESFLVEVGRNPFVDPQAVKSSDEKEEIYPFLRSITIRLSAQREDGCGIRWRDGIEKLSQKCPQLRNVDVRIYGKNENWSRPWWKDHDVLLELRVACREYLRNVSLAEYQYDTLGGIPATEAKILSWLQDSDSDSDSDWD